MASTLQRSSIPGWRIPAFQDGLVSSIQYLSVPAFQRSRMEKTNSAQLEIQTCVEIKAVLNFSSESSDDELLKSCETMISKIIYDQQNDESPSPEYQLCYVA